MKLFGKPSTRQADEENGPRSKGLAGCGDEEHGMFGRGNDGGQQRQQKSRFRTPQARIRHLQEYRARVGKAAAAEKKARGSK